MARTTQRSKATTWGLLLLLATYAAARVEAADGISFTRDIRPILSSHCFHCHGPDEAERQGGFRLDRQESALGTADSGEHPIVPGAPEESALLARIETDDESLRMPPAEANKDLDAEQRALLRRWIAEGAQWEDHWAFAVPQRPHVPEVRDAAWPRSPIDHFVLARLEDTGLAPRAAADKATLLRRVTLDLTGLPPTLAELDAFLADDTPEAYERAVDRLLKSPHYGEHMARYWLDAARYGDTHGLHLDNYREMWPYRDWVVRAFNNNMPFDQFVIEQLAGDLLPDATLDQLIASGFNRCHVTTAEGGSIEEEVYVRNVVDRVVTTATVFMGLTFECTRCHNHKYDPLTMQDFYSMFAFFNNLDGKPLDGNSAQHAPVVKVMTADGRQRLARIDQELADVERQIHDVVAQVDYDPARDDQPAVPPERREYVWIDDAVPAGATANSEGGPEGNFPFVQAPEPVYRGRASTKRVARGRSQHFCEGASPGLRIGAGDTLFAYVYLDPDHPPREIMLQWNTGQWQHRAYWGENLIDWGSDGSPERLGLGPLPATGQWVRLEVSADQVGIPAGSVIQGWAFTQFDGTVYWDCAGVVTAIPQGDQPFASLAAWELVQQAGGGQGLPTEIQKIVSTASSERNVQQRQQLRDYFVEHAYQDCRAQIAPLHAHQQQLRNERAEIEKNAPTTLVFRERDTLRPAYVLNRGEYDQRRDQVPRAVPAVLPPLPSDASRDRLGLAQWLVAPGHPLTARVTVNRLWQQVFGTGIVKTSEDFGSQGEPPSHPELLDWLAVDFRDSGWDVKRFMKQLVMSATYRQAASTTAELTRRDPENRLLARGPRFRLDAEAIRDQALAVSGLLVPKLGGPSVKPPQPDGLWFAVGYSGSNTVRFQADQGPDKVHRRTLYTFIKRTAPPPQMSTFDGPSREACAVRRERTNTPLQALLLMNDPQYVEAARGLAERVVAEVDGSPDARADTMFRLCTARHPSDAERRELVTLYEEQRASYQQQQDAAGRLAGVEQASAATGEVQAAELAAWTLVANLVLNLDEVVTKN